jgi:prepilin-type N-terminal cleavage/methylation domain-containing protein
MNTQDIEMITTRRANAGFTLIELLVVVAIIGTLVALSAGAYFKVRQSQQEKLTGETVSKLQKMFLQQWTAALDNAKKEPIPDIVKAYCQFDPDRSAAVWSYLHLRKNFPENVIEARSPVVLGAVAPTFPTATTIFPTQQIFLDRIPAAATSLSVDEQSAVCLYVALVEVNRRGMESGIGDSMTANWPPDSAATAQYKVFMDTFGRPICFRRLLSTPEMQAKPFTIQSANKDPLDPLGKLPGLPANFKSAIETAIGGSRTLNNTNFIPSIFSYGINRVRDFDASNNPIGDDIHGYRLNVEGRTGN